MPEAPILTTAALRVARRPSADYALLRVRDPSPEAVARLSRAAGVALPHDPNRTVGAAPRAWWIAPGTWLIRDHPPIAMLRAALTGLTGHVAAIGAGRVVFVVGGPDARRLMAHGTSIDLHPRAFGDGDCARTLFADVPALIDRSGDHEFDIHLDASLDMHLTRWFATVGAGLARPAT